MEEEVTWIDVLNYEKFYQVSDLGKIYSKRQKKIMKFKTDKAGYKKVNLFNEKGSKTFMVHRVVAISFLQNPENKPEVNHKNKIKSDNRLLNLEWSTVAENLEHKLNFTLIVEKIEKAFAIKIKKEICKLVPL